MTSLRPPLGPDDPGHPGHPDRPAPPPAFATALSPGDPQRHGLLTVVPLLFAGDRGPRYRMAAEAFADGTLQVGEVSHGGSVPNLLVVNGGDKPVLIVDGEELVGAKQNRILNTTVLVREKSELVVPVSCVEAGRWHYQGPAFHDEEYVVHPNVRR